MLAPIDPITWNCGKWWRKLTKADVGLEEVDNTSDLNKPISNATSNALERLDTLIMENRANILTHDGEILEINEKLGHIDDDIDQIYADLTNTVNKVATTVQNVNKGLTVSEVPSGSNALVTRGIVESTDGLTNNILHRVGYESYTGEKISVDSKRGYSLSNGDVAYDTLYPATGYSFIKEDIRDVNGKPIEYTSHSHYQANTREIDHVIFNKRRNGDEVRAYFRISLTETFTEVVLIVLKNEQEIGRVLLGRVVG